MAVMFFSHGRISPFWSDGGLWLSDRVLSLWLGSPITGEDDFARIIGEMIKRFHLMDGEELNPCHPVTVSLI